MGATHICTAEIHVTTMVDTFEKAVNSGKTFFNISTKKVSKRMNSHRFDINNFDSQGYASNVALHFNSYPHSIADFSFLPIDVVKDEMTRLCKETYWIHKLDTLHPKGMNSKLLYDV